mgnify:CR=1 FL=1
MNKRLLSMCVMAMMGVLLTAGKEVMAFLPNFEPVTLLIVLFTLSFGPVAMGAVCVFLLLEGLLDGFGSWWVMYLYIWPLLAALTWVFRRMDKAWQWAVFAGLYGLCFGTLCSLTYLPVGGVRMMFAWIISGLPFDFMHAGGNFLLMLLLYRPLKGALDRLRGVSGL